MTVLVYRYRYSALFSRKEPGGIMKPRFSKVSLLLISFAAIFGSGWLFAPFYAAKIAGPAALIAWVLGALISMVIGLTMAEVITLFPKSGGLNSIAGMTHGNLLAFFLTLFHLLVFVVLPAIEVRAIIQYSASRYNFLMNSSDEISLYGYGVAVFLLALITLVNLYGAKLTLVLNNLMVVFKVITPILVCVGFPYAVMQTESFSASRFTDVFAQLWPVPWDQVLKAISVSGIIFSFNGFNQATLYAGEAREPQRAVPFAILGSLVFSGALYFVIQYVFLVSVPPESYAQGWSSLAFAGDQGPFAALAVFLGLHWLLVIIYADAVISPLGTAFNYASSAPRLFYTLAQSNPTFERFMKLNRHGVPFLAMLLTFVLEFAAFVFLPSLKAMISILVSAFVLCYTTAPASLLTLRKTHAHLPRPFKMRYAPLFGYFSVFFSNLMAFSCGWMALRNLIFAAFIVFILIAGSVGMSLFLAHDKTKIDARKKQFHRDVRGVSWFLAQMAGLVILSYLENFAGLPFYFSFLGVAGVSAGALLLSQKVRLDL